LSRRYFNLFDQIQELILSLDVTPERDCTMSNPKVRHLTPSSEGQVILSASAREKLGLDKGANVLEVVTAGCVLLIPEDPVLSEAMKSAREALARTGVTVDEINAEIERLKEERFTRDYPDLAS
jgi:bifunctional DNA-binding transcriptional regulator/antitoxin component of YhaV-PrlF toxin-antitoxin module